jgi:hypothetical protein
MRGGAHIGECAKGHKMRSLVPESKPTQNLIVGAGSSLGFSTVPQEDPQVAACWSVKRNEIGGCQAHTSRTDRHLVHFMVVHHFLSGLLLVT